MTSASSEPPTLGPLLSTIHSPGDVKKLADEDLPKLADEIRHTLIDCLSKTGGHLGPNLGVVELTVAMHRVFSTPEVVEWSATGCRTAGIGCRDCKAALKTSLSEAMEPIRARRAAIEGDPARVAAILDEGADRARATAQATRAQARAAMGLA